MVGYRFAAFRSASASGDSSAGREADRVLVSEATEKVLRERVVPFTERRMSVVESQSSFEEPGAWWKFTKVNPEVEGYTRFRTRQFYLLEAYFDHLQAFDGEGFTDYRLDFPERLSDGELADHVASLVLGLNAGFATLRELLSFGVFDDDFRRYVRESPIDYRRLQSEYGRLTYDEDAETYRTLAEARKILTEYSDYVLGYEFESSDPGENPHAVVERPFSGAPPYQMDFMLRTYFDATAYLEGYGERSARFQEHVDSFSPDSRKVQRYRAAATRVLKNQS